MLHQSSVHIHKILLPISFLYRIGIGIRNWLFDHNILPSQEYDIPIIGVGNICVGGSGKSPHVEYLVRQLGERYKIAILSRGYKRKSRGFILADDLASAQRIGDEPFQFYKKFPNVIIAVCESRKEGIDKILNMAQKPDLILMDDAYQHRYVKPGLSILIADYNRLPYYDTLLPAGRLREPFSSKSRAQVMIVSKCPDNLKPIDYRIITKHMSPYPYQSLFFSQLQYGELISFDPEDKPKIELDLIRHKFDQILIFSGIASSALFEQKIIRRHPHCKVIRFSDHRNFSNKNLREIASAFETMSEGKKAIITTEKDYMRLQGMPNIPSSIRENLYYLPILVKITSGEEHLLKILSDYMLHNKLKGVI